MAQSGGSGRIIHWESSYGIDLGARAVNSRADAIIGMTEKEPNMYAVFDGLGYDHDPHFVTFHNYPDFAIVCKSKFGGRGAEPDHVFFSADNKSAYVFCAEGHHKEGDDITIVDIESGEHKKRFNNCGKEKEALSAVCMLADKKHFVVCAKSSRAIRVIKADDGTKVAEIGKKESVFYNVKSAKAFSKGTRAIVGGINSDGKGVSQILSFEGGALKVVQTIVEDNNEVYDVAVSADETYLLTASRGGVAVYDASTYAEVARLGGDAAPLHIAVPNTPPTKGPFTFAVGYMGGSVKLMTLVRNKDDFIDDDTLIAERDKVIANKGPGASGTGAAAQKEASGGVIIAQPPRNTMPRDQVPAGEGAKGRVYIDGKSIVPTSDKLYYRTKWATPDGRMTKNPSFLVEWDDKDGAVTMISAQVVKIGEDGNPDYTDMFMCQTASMIKPGETVKYEPGTLMHINNGQTEMGLDRLPAGHYMVAVSVVLGGGAESFNVAVAVSE